MFLNTALVHHDSCVQDSYRRHRSSRADKKGANNAHFAVSVSFTAPICRFEDVPVSIILSDYALKSNNGSRRCMFFQYYAANCFNAIHSLCTLTANKNPMLIFVIKNSTFLLLLKNVEPGPVSLCCRVQLKRQVCFRYLALFSAVFHKNGSIPYQRVQCHDMTLHTLYPDGGNFHKWSP